MPTDPVFEQEQEHLTVTYAKLSAIEESLAGKLAADLDEALADKEALFDEMTRDFSSDIQVESLAELESMNRIIEDYNLAADIDNEKLRSVQLLLKSPYFAKVTLRFASTGKSRDVYLGSVGMADEDYRHFIVDWRSPVAEVYYNQQIGPTSYEANGRKIEVDLELRRQFDIDREKLNAYFDTTVAIEDPLLLASLSKGRTDHLSAITTTIQREQNQVIRHADVPALLVNGIAGSGKTSVLLQRIAYLFYTERNSLSPSDVYLLTPNPVFGRYIDNVLPDMGESNPQILTWNSLMDELGLSGRGVARSSSATLLERIDEAVPLLELSPADFSDVRVGDEVVVKASSARASWLKFAHLPAGTHRSTLAIEDMEDKVAQRIMRMAADEDVQDELSEMPLEEQLDLFGRQVTPFGEEEAADITREWLELRYRPAIDAIRGGGWLRLDRIGMRMLGIDTLDSCGWLYLKLALVGGGERGARYVMVDEVQDYTTSQLKVLARYYPHAHFLLLGDENQAVSEGCATFAEIRDVFESACGQVDECSLLTSYRSTPEITALFCKLLPEHQKVNASSVQRDGLPPEVVECPTPEAYEQALRDAVDQAASEGGLCALIANSKTRAKQLARLLADTPVKSVSDDGALPAEGVVLLDVKLAKGLEFDHVIIPDVDDGAFPDEPVRRHRLYTAISRATKRATLIAQGKLTRLLAD